MNGAETSVRFEPLIENAAAQGRFVLVCEHGSNAFPEAWGDLGLTAAERAAHIAWDPGALDLARALALRLENAIASVIAKGEARTYDMGGATKCSEMGNAVIAEL